MEHNNIFDVYGQPAFEALNTHWAMPFIENVRLDFGVRPFSSLNCSPGLINHSTRCLIIIAPPGCC